MGTVNVIIDSYSNNAFMHECPLVVNKNKSILTKEYVNSYRKIMLSQFLI